MTTSIHVALLDEGVDVWRPVEAEQVSHDVYRILEQPYDRATERWQFGPGSEVVCETRPFADGPILVAAALAQRD